MTPPRIDSQFWRTLNGDGAQQEVESPPVPPKDDGPSRHCQNILSKQSLAIVTTTISCTTSVLAGPSYDPLILITNAISGLPSCAVSGF